MIRRLSSEERALWETLRRSVRPLRAEPAARKPDAPALQGPEERSQAKENPGTAAAPSSRARSEPPLVALEQRALRRLSRGLTDVEARIDLHGMRQERAFNALVAFLRRSQAKNLKLVLVITGKGREGEEGRGVLRQSVPAWLARPEFRDLVGGFEEAGRRHGGAGALYVRVRRRDQSRHATLAR